MTKNPSEISNLAVLKHIFYVNIVCDCRTS
jgi:hypothetical protein